MFNYVVLLLILLFIVIQFAKIRVPPEPFRNNDAVVCCIAKFEENYLKEWVTYHIKLGFSRVYIYDNSDNNSLKTFFKDSPLENHVTIIHFPGKLQQYPVYNHFIKNNSKHHTWAAIIDCDEFITMEHFEPITDYLKKNCKSGSLAMSWRLFGDGGRRTYSPEPVVERFTLCQEKPNNHVKIIAKCEDLVNMDNAHFAHLKPGKIQRDSTGRDMGMKYFNDKPTLSGIYLNHYFCKTLEEWKKKQARGNPSPMPQHIRADSDFDGHNFNEVEDTKARDFSRSDGFS